MINSTNYQQSISWLRLIGLLEGISYLLLMGVTLPLKKIYGIIEPNYFMGMTHGCLFILYVLLVFLAQQNKKWSFITTGWALFASLVPFGTFVADKKIFNKK